MVIGLEKGIRSSRLSGEKMPCTQGFDRLARIDIMAGHYIAHYVATEEFVFTEYLGPIVTLAAKQLRQSNQRRIACSIIEPENRLDFISRPRLLPFFKRPLRKAL